MSGRVTSTRADRARELSKELREPRGGIFITGENRMELLDDEIPAEMMEGDFVLAASIGNIRCTSDDKAVRQFTGHIRIPPDATQIALGHETILMIVSAGPDSGVKPGDVVALTPGHASRKIDPLTFRDDPDNGVLAALGYSYRYLGGLRRFNAIPRAAISNVQDQGFGRLFHPVNAGADVSLASLAHAEPFACNYGSNRFIFVLGENGEFLYGVPPRAIVAYLGGTSRMAMINLTILANLPESERPTVVYITGSRNKLNELEHFDLIRNLREAGTHVELIDRRDPNVIEKLTWHGRPHVIWTNFAASEVYVQATSAIAPGGNINIYAGAADSDLVIPMDIGPAGNFASFEEEAEHQVNAMHHNVHPVNPSRRRGLHDQPVVHFSGFSDDERILAYLQKLPGGARVSADTGLPSADRFSNLDFRDHSVLYTDVFIASSGDEAAAAYRGIEKSLARNSAVNFVTGSCRIEIESKFTHYHSRHQVCGDNVPWHMTNTSEPLAIDLEQQAAHPISFDWLIRGVAGLNHTLEMFADVEERKPFGSYFTFMDLPDIPYVAVDADTFRKAAASRDEPVRAALLAGADALEAGGNTWSRKVEEAIYEAHGISHPLRLKES
jgi:hypothetical protein